MLAIAPQIRIYLHAAPVDMRKSFDGLYGIILNDLAIDVRSGGLFLFINRSRNRIKILYWDKDGLAIWMKRLEQGSFQHPRPNSNSKHLCIDTSQLQLLLSGIELESVKRRKRYVAPAMPALPPVQAVAPSA